MNTKLSRKKLREFGYFLGISFPVFVGWLIPLITGHGFRTWTLLASIPLIFIGTVAPHKLRILFTWWMRLGLLLGWINSRIILTFVFLLVLIPIAVFMRLIGYDPMGIKKNIKSTFKIKNNQTKIDLTRIF